MYVLPMYLQSFIINYNYSSHHDKALPQNINSQTAQCNIPESFEVDNTIIEIQLYTFAFQAT